MKKVRTISLVFLFIFYSAFLMQLPDFLDKTTWFHTTATITLIGTPSGVVYGNYSGYMGKEYTNAILYIDYSLAGHGKNVEQHIGEEVEIIYDFDGQGGFEIDEEKGIMYQRSNAFPKTAHYPDCFKGFITASIALGVSLALFITSTILLKGKDKRRQPDKHAG